MDVSDLRRKILRALDDARVDAEARRKGVDTARRAYDDFLERVAVPLLRQAQSILKAEKQMFTVHAPAGSVRLSADNSAETFVEFILDATGARPQVVGRVSTARGGKRVHVEERPIAPDTPIDQLTDDDVARFLLTEIPKLVARS
jgi:hypothetical protein